MVVVIMIIIIHNNNSNNYFTVAINETAIKNIEYDNALIHEIWKYIRYTT